MTEQDDEAVAPATWREQIRWCFNDRLEYFVWRLYKRTGHYHEGRMHDMFLNDLLDELGAPKYPDNDPTRPKYGAYGRLRAWAEANRLIEKNTIHDRP